MNRSVSALFVFLQYLLPKRQVSRLFFVLTRIRWTWFKNVFIRVFCRLYPVSMDEALKSNINEYSCFNEFFTRELKPGVRRLDGPAQRVVCPVDGTICQLGRIDGDRLLQAKNRPYRLAALLADPKLAAVFNDGSFATIYLAPFNYHRVHMPVAGRLLSMRYVPGQLFSVNEATMQRIDRLFARNERIVCEFETAAGRMVQVMVGAMNVGSMATVWAGDVTPRTNRTVECWQYSEQNLRYQRGSEIGRFNMGSTVIVLFAPGSIRLNPQLEADQAIELGQTLGECSVTTGTEII